MSLRVGDAGFINHFRLNRAGIALRTIGWNILGKAEGKEERGEEG